MRLRFGSAAESEPCAIATSTTGGGGDGAYVQASFCTGPKLISALTAAGAAAKSAGDPQFRQLLDQVVINLLPTTAPGQSKGGGGL